MRYIQVRIAKAFLIRLCWRIQLVVKSLVLSLSTSILCSVCEQPKWSGETLKMRKLIWVEAHAISDKISCTDTYIHVDKWYTLQVFTSVPHLRKCWAKGYGGLWGEDLEWGRGKCASLYTEISVWDGLVVVWCVSVNTTILHTFLSEPACTACTNMVYSKELECDVTTTAKALLRL